MEKNCGSASDRLQRQQMTSPPQRPFARRALPTTAGAANASTKTTKMTSPSAPSLPSLPAPHRRAPPSRPPQPPQSARPAKRRRVLVTVGGAAAAVTSRFPWHMLPDDLLTNITDRLGLPCLHALLRAAVSAGHPCLHARLRRAFRARAQALYAVLDVMTFVDLAAPCAPGRLCRACRDARPDSVQGVRPRASPLPRGPARAGQPCILLPDELSKFGPHALSLLPPGAAGTTGVDLLPMVHAFRHRERLLRQMALRIEDDIRGRVVIAAPGAGTDGKRPHTRHLAGAITAAAGNATCSEIDDADGFGDSRQDIDSDIDSDSAAAAADDRDDDRDDLTPTALCARPHLHLSFISATAAERLARDMPSLRTLLLRGGSGGSDGSGGWWPRLTSLPDAFGALAQLTELDLSNQDFACVPAPVLQLRGLQRLRLSGNARLAMLPDDIGQRLPALAVLHAARTALAALPTSLFVALERNLAAGAAAVAEAGAGAAAEGARAARKAGEGGAVDGAAGGVDVRCIDVWGCRLPGGLLGRRVVRKKFPTVRTNLEAFGVLRTRRERT